MWVAIPNLPVLRNQSFICQVFLKPEDNKIDSKFKNEMVSSQDQLCLCSARTQVWTLAWHGGLKDLALPHLQSRLLPLHMLQGAKKKRDMVFELALKGKSKRSWDKNTHPEKEI